MAYTEIIENGNTLPPLVPDKWTPKLSGTVYCSPACGGGCTKADFDKATTSAQHLANRLGHGWFAHVWENLGWHWEANKRRAGVTLQEDGKYRACIRFDMQDDVESYIEEIHSTPNQAVLALIVNIGIRIHTLQRAVSSLTPDPFMLPTNDNQKTSGTKHGGL